MSLNCYARTTCMVLLPCVLPTLRLQADDVIDKSQFLPTARQQWAAYREHLGTKSGSASRVVYDVEQNEKLLPHRIDVEFVQAAHCNLLKGHEVSATGVSTETASGSNARYSFEVVKNSKGEWKARSSREHPDHDSIQEVIDDWVLIGIRVYDLTLSEILAEKGKAIVAMKSIKVADKTIVECTFDTSLLKNINRNTWVKKGTVLIDPDRYYTVVSYCVEYVSANGQGQLNGTIHYAFDELNFPLVQSTSVRQDTSKRTDNGPLLHRDTRVHLSYRDVPQPEQRCSLSAFGLPEPAAK